MEPYFILILTGIVALGLGFLFGNSVRKGKNKILLDEAKTQAKEILQSARLESEALRKEKKLQAKEHFIELKSNHQREVNQRERKVSEMENRIKQKESQLQKEINSNTDLKRKLQKEIEFIQNKQRKIASRELELNDVLEVQIGKLEGLSKLSAEEAKTELMNTLKGKAKADAMSYIQGYIEEAKLTAQQEAKKIVINTIQRIGTEEAIDNCVSI